MRKRQREIRCTGGNMTMETEIGVMLYKQDCLQPPEAERGKEQSSLEHPERP